MVGVVAAAVLAEAGTVLVVGVARNTAHENPGVIAGLPGAVGHLPFERVVPVHVATVGRAVGQGVGDTAEALALGQCCRHDHDVLAFPERGRLALAIVGGVLDDTVGRLLGSGLTGFCRTLLPGKRLGVRAGSPVLESLDGFRVDVLVTPGHWLQLHAGLGLLGRGLEHDRLTDGGHLLSQFHQVGATSGKGHGLSPHAAAEDNSDGLDEGEPGLSQREVKLVLGGLATLIEDGCEGKDLALLVGLDAGDAGALELGHGDHTPGGRVVPGVPLLGAMGTKCPAHSA